MWLQEFEHHRAVLIDGATGDVATRADIEARADRLRAEVVSGGLAFLLAEPTLDSATTFHALLAARIPVALVDGTASAETTAALIDRYRPEVVLRGRVAEGPTTAVAGTDRAATASSPTTHPDLAVLLTTSGSTGSPKLVRLSHRNISTNARQIARSLSLTSADRGVTALPFHYSFGMSVLTSHASVGSPVVVTGASVLEPELWDQIDAHGVTLFPGVPQTYQMLRRLRFASEPLSTVRGLMQAGGRLDPNLINEFAAVMAARGGEFYVMYGQTEASPRIACLPPADLIRKLGSAGKALAGGTLEARSPDGATLPAGEAGEIVYTGPNVMMGYAESRADLELGDTHGDTLATGDLGYLDDEGFLFLTGRSKRIAKIAGLRISLDEVEAMAPELQPTAVEAPAGTITLTTLVAESDGDGHTRAARVLAKSLRVPPKLVRILHIDALPLLPNGKVDYRALEALAGQR